ncbi:MAG: hypothetical protein IPJ71_08725 [Bdellovibrionales bacterium]|nr:hypothetical protein [Bdellovibrionales bacterium]
MQIASLGPMVIVSDDDKLDHELESRRIRLEKAKAGGAHPSGMDQEVGEAPDDSDTREGLERFLKFLKKEKEKEKEKEKGLEVDDFSVGEETEIPTEFAGLGEGLEESGRTNAGKKSRPPSIKTARNCMIFLYEKSKTVEEDLQLKGFHFDKAA